MRSEQSSLTAVAQLAGVSIATASRVINGHGSVAETTRTKVMAAARDLGYVPDPRFRAMGQRNAPQTGHIGLILSSTSKAKFIASPFYGRLFWSIEQACSELGRHVLVTTLAGDADEFLPRFARDLQVDGVIVVDHLAADTAARLNAVVPVVTVKAAWELPTIPGVSTNEASTVRLGLRHLRELGHRTVAFFDIADSTPPNVQHQQRHREFRMQTSVADDWWRHTRCVALTSRESSLSDTAALWLARWLAEPNPPTAIFCASDLYAHAFIQAGETMGIPIPARFSVIGVDDEIFGQYCRPTLTTIRQPFEAMGRLAVRMLIDRLEGGRDAHQPSISLDVEIVVRESTGAAPAEPE